MKFKNLLLSSVVAFGMLSSSFAKEQESSKVEATDVNLSADDISEEAELSDNQGFVASLGALGSFSTFRSVGLMGKFGYSTESFVFGTMVTAMYNFLPSDKKNLGKDCFSVAPGLIIGIHECEGLPHGVDMFAALEFMFADKKDKMHALNIGIMMTYFLFSKVALLAQVGFDILLAENPNGHKKSKKETVVNPKAVIGLEVRF